MAATTVFKDEKSIQTLTDLHVRSTPISQVSTVYCNSEKLSEADLERVDKTTLDGGADGEAKYPEGGRQAWLVVLGSFLCITASFGIMNTTGTLQVHLLKHQLAQYSLGEIGWIFGVYTFLSFFCGILVGMFM